MTTETINDEITIASAYALMDGREFTIDNSLMRAGSPVQFIMRENQPYIYYMAVKNGVTRRFKVARLNDSINVLVERWLSTVLSNDNNPVSYHLIEIV